MTKNTKKNARPTVAVIPAAGLGTRLMPATKAVPKELISILDKPSIMYVIEEAIEAGIKKIVLVSGPGKEPLSEFFSTDSMTLRRLRSEGKTELVMQFLKFREQFELEIVMQEKPLGLGHAVLMAKESVGDQPFVVMLPDELNRSIKGSSTPTRVLCDNYESNQSSSVWIAPVQKEQVHLYGVVDLGGKEFSNENDLRTTGLQILSLVEKPQANEAPSLFALPGRYVFNPSIFKNLENTKPGRGGEIQLTDAMNAHCKQEALLGVNVDALRYDVGNKLGLIKTIIDFAIADESIAKETQAHLKSRGLLE